MPEPWLDGAGWRTIPKITVLAAPDDRRVSAVGWAAEFWNKELRVLGSAFRLDAVSHVPDVVSADDLHKIYGVLSRRPADDEHKLRVRELLARMFRMPDEIIVVLASGRFIGFAMPRIRHGKSLVLIATDPAEQQPDGFVAHVAAHELGHAIGLDHNTELATLMCGGTTACNASHRAASRILPLTAQERRTLQEMYPPDWTPDSPARRKVDPLPSAG